MPEQRQEILAHHAAHHVADRELPCFFVGIGDEYLTHHAPVLPVRLAAGFGGAGLDRFPVARHIGRIEIEAHRNIAAFAGELQCVGALAEARDADRRMRRLQRLDVRFKEVEHGVRLVHRPELALIRPGRILGPHLQDDLQRFPRHVAVLAGHSVDVEHRPVARQAARRDAEIQPAAGEVIEHRHAVGEFGGVMVRQQEATGSEADVLGLQEGLREQKVRRGMRLPRRGVMLADPGLAVAEFVEPAHHLQIPVVAFLQSAFRRMRRHREISDLHGVSSRRLTFQRVLLRVSRLAAA